MNISICIPVLNEKKSVGSLIESILHGTKMPDEIVFVDGGSTDATASVISNYQFPISNKKIKFKLIKTKNNGIAKDRNISIKRAIGDVIVQIDAGCIAKKDWLEKITKPFTTLDESLLVAGFYEMTGKSALQRAVSVFHGVPPEKFNNHFVPSARSVAFNKNIWKKVGGYRENLKRAGEDTDFFYRIIKKGYKIARVKNAIVYWEVPKTLKESFNKFFNYAKGDAKTGIWWHPEKQFASHNVKISIVFLRYIFGVWCLVYGIWFPVAHVMLVILFILYLLYPVFKWSKIIKNWQSRLWLPVIQILSDIAVMSGFISGIIQ